MWKGFIKYFSDGLDKWLIICYHSNQMMYIGYGSKSKKALSGVINEY